VGLSQLVELKEDPSNNYFVNLAAIYRESGHYEKVIEASKKALQFEPNTQMAYITLAISYIRLGRDEEARGAAAEICRINPKFSVDSWMKMSPYKDPAQTEKIANATRKAGLK